MVNIRCSGCGAFVPDTAGPVHRYMTSAPGCWAMYGELNALLLSDPAAAGFRQLCVDAWAVQHPGKPSPQTIQSIAGHLLSLYSALVLDTPEQSCRDVIRRVTSRKGAYRWLTPPPFKGARTIVDISPTHVADDAHHWATDAWFAWRSHHGQVRTWYAELFAP